MVQLIDGKLIREKILATLKKQIQEDKLKPKLAIILVGDDEASKRYIEQKKKAAAEIEAKTEIIQLPSSISEQSLEREISRLNNDKETNGIIVQLPLPKHLNKEKIIENIAKNKDVDGLVSGSPFRPATAEGIMQLLDEYQVKLSGKKAAVLGQSQLVGSPLSLMLEEAGASVTRIDINTPPPISPLVSVADIIVSAVGKINLITADMVKKGAVVIDVGTNIDSKTGKLVGDVDFEKVKEIASLITPVPGGVGPMTVAMLMKNLVQAAKLQAS